MRKLSLVFILWLLLSCENSKISYNVPFEYIEDSIYDVPAKTMVIKSIIIDENTPKSALAYLIDSLYKSSIDSTYKYYNPPSQVFVRAYASKKEFELNGGLYIASRSKNIDAEDDTTVFNTDLSFMRSLIKK